MARLRAFVRCIKMKINFNLLLILLHHFLVVRHGRERPGVQQ